MLAVHMAESILTFRSGPTDQDRTGVHTLSDVVGEHICKLRFDVLGDIKTRYEIVGSLGSPYLPQVDEVNALGHQGDSMCTTLYSDSVNTEAVEGSNECPSTAPDIDHSPGAEHPVEYVSDLGVCLQRLIGH
jgi:hypothetical protein